MKPTVEAKIIVFFKYKSLKFKDLSKEAVLKIDEAVFVAGGTELQEVIENHVWEHLVVRKADAEINHSDYSESEIAFIATINDVSEESVELLSNYYSEDVLKALDEADVENALEYELLEKVKDMVGYRVFVNEQELFFN